MLKLGELVYVIDFLQRKNPHTILGSIGRVTHIAEGGRTYQIQLLNNQKVTRHMSSLVSTRCNIYDCQTQSLDPLCLPQTQDVIPPSMLRSKFDAYLNTLDLSQNGQNIPDVLSPVSNIVDGRYCCWL